MCQVDEWIHIEWLNVMHVNCRRAAHGAPRIFGEGEEDRMGGLFKLQHAYHGRLGGAQTNEDLLLAKNGPDMNLHFVWVCEAYGEPHVAGKPTLWADTSIHGVPLSTF